MKLEEMFRDARWLAAGTYDSISNEQEDPSGTPHFPILRRTFTVEDPKKVRAMLRVVGLGFFHAYVNGNEVTEDQFLPLSTDVESRGDHPTGEILTGHRLIVPEFDVSGLLKKGENVLCIHFGGGWYTFEPERYGDPKVIYCLILTGERGEQCLVSSEQDTVYDSPVKTYYFTRFEKQDYTGFDPAIFFPGFHEEGKGGRKPILAAAPDTEYETSACPADRVAKRLNLTLIGEKDGVRTYDCGCNISGYPLVTLGKSGHVRLTFSEERLPEGAIDPKFSFGQHFEATGQPGLTVHPDFTWFGFRYLQVEGDAEPFYVLVVHTDVALRGWFHCENETLNWMYEAYLNTQLCNMHAGIPSDCPHIERRGYTGDGELTAHAVMDLLDAKEFYRKWINDIGDCQDTLSGHVQYTAPYTRCGGGPGAWGCAIVEVPYQFYRHYGEIEPMIRLYPQMWKYFDYLEAHSCGQLVISDKPGEWCLGDWCTNRSVALPAPFVNNYYYVRSMLRLKELCPLIGKEGDIPELDRRIALRKEAMTAAYFNTWDGNFIGGLQGANAFAVDLGLGDERTYQNLVKRYAKLGYFDTGICGTEVLIRVLMEHGDGETALTLLLSDQDTSFEGWHRRGATTLWEYFPDSLVDRSHSHPMFGAVVAYFFDYLLGFDPADPEGEIHTVLTPAMLARTGTVSGWLRLPEGLRRVKHELVDGQVRTTVETV